MGRKLLLMTLLIWGALSVGRAQEDGKIVLKGTVLDGKTGEPVAFVNLGLLGTVAGVASDMDGQFELVIPDRYATHVVRFSAVGYAPKEMKVYEMQDKPNLKISLQPVSYGIGEVDVYGQLLVYKKMLQNVVSNISKNYIDKPYNYEGYFKYWHQEDTLQRMKEATVTIYDAQGYHRDDVASAFKDLNYRFNEVRRDREATSVKDGLMNFDDILTADIVRNTRNVLDIVNSRDYKLKGKAKMIYEGDSVQVISYQANQPSISTTGDPAVQTYEGEIYINRKDMAVLKNVTHITSRNFNILGRNLVAINEKPKSDVKMTLTTTYKKVRSVYFLSGVTVEYSYREEGKEVQGELEYITTRVEMNAPTPIEGRIYYEDIQANDEFWNRYSVYFEE